MSLKISRANCTDKCLSCSVNVNAFPGKLWKLVNDANYQSILWSICGTTIVIDAHHFKEEVLRTGEYSIFKTQNFSSFVRQLNLYGFRKIATTASAKFTEYKTNMERGSYSKPLHCFAHTFFLQHRPDLLARVRRTSAANKRRSGFGQEETTFYGQCGNTFRILGRCGQNAAPSFITSGSGPSVYPSSLNIGSRATAQQFVHAAQPGHMPSYVYNTSDSESDYADADDLTEESSNSSALLKKSSAKVWWGQGQSTHAKGDTSNESSPCSQSSANLISKAEKGSIDARQTPDEAVPFPSSLYDARGRLQEFRVVQHSPNLGLGVGVPPRAFSESPSLDHFSTNQTTSPSFWSPVLGSSHSAMPVGVDPDIYGYHQVLDYSSAHFPYMTAYPSAPYMSYGPTSAAPPENMMSMAYYPGSPAISNPNSNYTTSPCCNHYDKDEAEDDDDGGEEEDVPRENFKKVVVKQELVVSHSYSALVEEGEELPSPQQVQRRFVWNDCDNERERVEMYAKKAQQSLYTTEG